MIRATFFDRELCGLKRSFVALVLVLDGVESSSKNDTNGTKNVGEQNLFPKEQKTF